jgi:S1-C subfamily serine protease
LKVEPSSPAARGELREGDIIVAMDGQPTPRVETLHRTLTADRIGRPLQVRALRGVELLTLTLLPVETP